MTAFLALQIISDETGQKTLTLDTPIEALGLDSLEFIDLIVKVSADTGVEISAASVGAINTVGDLVRAVEK